MSGPGRNRREFLQLAATTGLSGAYLLSAPRQEPGEPVGPPVKCAVIGIGQRGRELLTVLESGDRSHVLAICDVFAPYLRRGQRIAPDANTYSDFSILLKEQEDVETVFVTTPTHLHREVVEAALTAGKHVFCEAPMASSIEDAVAIEAAARSSGRTFAVGLQLRSNRHFRHALGFVEAGAIGTLALDSGSHASNNSWRRASSDPEYEKKLNWRLSPDVSLGLIGETGVHAFDTTLRSSKEFPSAVTSFGSLVKWKDGRDVPDSIQCIFEFPSGLQSRYVSTLTNSYGGRSHLLNGTAGSILLTEERCWLFKEVDAPTFGWEVYASRERVVDQDGIVLVADATKLLEQQQMPSSALAEGQQSGPDSMGLAVEDFFEAIRTRRAPAAGAIEGLNSVVMAVKALEAMRAGTRVTIDAGLFRV